MAEAPRVSVIMPTHNVAPFVEEAIASVVAQTWTQWELVVIDDQSTDATPDVVRRHRDPRIRLIEKSREGVSRARNRGLSEATGSIISFLDGDDRWRPDALERLVAALEAREDRAVAYGEGVVMNAAGAVYGPESAPALAARPSGDVVAALLAANCIVNAGATAVRRRALEQAGGFDESLQMGEDWELWVRLAMVGPFHYIGGAPILEYRQRAGSATRLLVRDIAEGRKALDRAFGNPELEMRLGAVALRRLRRRREAALYAHAGTECLKARQWAEGRRCFGQALRRRPMGAREWVLWFLAVARWLPDGVGKRLK